MVLVISSAPVMHGSEGTCSGSGAGAELGQRGHLLGVRGRGRVGAEGLDVRLRPGRGSGSGSERAFSLQKNTCILLTLTQTLPLPLPLTHLLVTEEHVHLGPVGAVSLEVGERGDDRSAGDAERERALLLDARLRRRGDLVADVGVVPTCQMRMRVRVGTVAGGYRGRWVSATHPP
eukprot:scaffold59120_cov29-Phaeocystis_antarctica.AAC.2